MDSPYSIPIHILPTEDGDNLARTNQAKLLMDRPSARELGWVATEILERGTYIVGYRQIPIADTVRDAVARTVSIRPGEPLPEPPDTVAPASLTLSVANETSLSAARRLLDAGSRPLVLNFANAIEPGGGFLSGSVAQEEYLARSSGLYATIKSDPMYRHHRDMGTESFLASEWAILSPDVPVFRGDDGLLLTDPWLCSMLTCAAPVARKVGLDRASAVMKTRIGRVLEIARAYGYRSLVLGAWGCGAFHNDPVAIARLFRESLTGEFLGAFEDVIFAITDWSPDRRYLSPFRDTFAELG